MSSGSSFRYGDAAPRGWIAEHTSWMKPGSVRGAEREPPPIVSPASSTRTDLPARAISIAAASPLGPAPTTTASYAGPLIAGSGYCAIPLGERLPDGPHRGTGHVQARSDRRVLLDVAPVLPLPLLVDHDALDGRARLDAEMVCELLQHVQPHAVLGPLAAEHHADFVHRVLRADESLHLRHDDAAGVEGAERDHAVEHVPFGCHERERFVVCVEDENAGRRLHAPRFHVQQGDVAGSDGRRRSEELVLLRPEGREVG